MPPASRFRLSRTSLPSVLVLATFAPITGASAQTTAPIAIILADYEFSPATLDLKQGTAYQLHFTNSGSKSHNFTAPEFFAASQIAPEDMAKVKNGTIELGNGQSADITVTPGRAGTYEFVCTHFMHKTMGMHGEITVH
jgi:plastocyanin